MWSQPTLAVVVAEVGNGLEVRCQSTGQPHQLDVALRLALQTPTGPDPVQVAINVDLEQHRRVVRRPPRHRRISASKAKLHQIEFFDKGVDRADRVVLDEVVVQTLGQQRDLRAVFTFDKSLHTAAQKKVSSSI